MNFAQKFLTGVALSAAMSGAALATPVYGTGLQTGLDASVQDGSFYDVSVEGNQYNPDEQWSLDGASSGTAVMAFEYAGFAGSNTFGLYQLGNEGHTLELFNGAAAQGDRTVLQQIGTKFIANYFDENGAFLGQNSIDLGGTTHFGFYMAGPGGTFYSQAHLNGDTDGDGVEDDHLIAFQGDDELMMDPDGDGYYGLFTSGNFVLAWEDLAFGNGSDRDYSDMVLFIESYVPVPAPAGVALLGLGLLALGARRRA